MSKKFKKMMKNVCFKCRKIGYNKAECPKLRKRGSPRKKKREKNLLTWEDVDSSSGNSNEETADEETATICLMAKDLEPNQKMGSFDKAQTKGAQTDEAEPPN